MSDGLDYTSAGYTANIKHRLAGLRMPTASCSDPYRIDTHLEHQLTEDVQRVVDAEINEHRACKREQVIARVPKQSEEYRNFLSLRYQMKRDMRQAAKIEVVNRGYGYEYTSEHIEESKKILKQCDAELALLSMAFPWIKYRIDENRV